MTAYDGVMAGTIVIGSIGPGESRLWRGDFLCDPNVRPGCGDLLHNCDGHFGGGRGEANPRRNDWATSSTRSEIQNVRTSAATQLHDDGR